ncbi:MAG: transcription antitermination factor NusB [Candidatus Aminicenantes bacterium]|nr:transcription antitermination factor NusB [Candidatus Aminicenantes bacterium]
MFRIKYSREVTLKLLYQIDVLDLGEKAGRDILENNLNFFKGLNQKEKDFIQKMVLQVLSNIRTIDDQISKLLIDWSLKRLTPVDRNLLRMGIAESSFNTEKAIIIDDIIRISKKYSGEDSYKIINAILDKVIV